MSANKVILNGDVLIDLTEDTTVESDVRQAKTFHKANGEPAVGTSSGLDINGIVKQYKVNAGASVSAGDFVEFVTRVGTVEFDNRTADEIRACAIDEQRALLIYSVYESEVYNLYGVVIQVSNSGVIVGNIKKLASGTTLRCLWLISLSNSRAFSTFESGGFCYGTLLSVDDANDVIVVYKASLGNCDYSKYTMAVKLSNNYVLVTYAARTTARGTAIVATIEGDSYTIGTPYVYSESYAYNGCLTALNSNKVLVAYQNGSSSSTASFRAQVLTIEGTAIASGAVKSITSGYITNEIKAVTLNENTAFLTYHESGYNSFSIRVITVNGTTISASYSISLSGDPSSGRYNSAIVPLPNNSALFVYRGVSGKGSAVILTANGTTVEKGTVTTFESLDTKLVAIADFSANSVLVAYNCSGASKFKGLIINDTSIIVEENESGTFVQPATSNLFNVGVAKTSGTEGETVDVYCVE